ncbi:hypothetical protein SBRY_80286 [Actinacidiphila bryophytorum]|uniref:Uncharacterized protein n=1 Tax=Actinacidiphila bryophytorum TaxID=1436133 RepID=A0A9W4H8A0_9ACTN|nr:hypothetical protein SBRY_80286 [Actinacidiphila bryophytorum]
MRRGHPQGRGELRAQPQRTERYERAASGNHPGARGTARQAHHRGKVPQPDRRGRARGPGGHDWPVI